ncbi:MAG: 4Fe-4S binding protein [Tissierellia bacterium]|nr:4Fe-4S binding protein [Tissierellia bacterium]
MITIKLNGKEISVKENQTIYNICKENHIEIPTLCHLNLHQIGYFNMSGSCRVCSVELKNQGGKLITSCNTLATEGMDIVTHSPKAVKARKSVVELLLSDHPNDCLYCHKNDNCELQSMASDLGVRKRRFMGEQTQFPINDQSSPSIVHDPNKCILCKRCETMCSMIQTVKALGSKDRGFHTQVGPVFDMNLTDTVCTSCGQCLTVCPTGALMEKTNIDNVWDALQDKRKIVIGQTAPAVRVALGEEFGYEPGTDVTGKMVGAMKELGFDYVFDTNFAADLTIVEEGNELLERLQTGGPFPIITSCCPAWVNFMESQFSDMIPLVSSAKSPHQMNGAVIKNYFAQKIGVEAKDIVVVSIMPCVAKKYESNREELTGEWGKDVDIVITTRELGRMIKEAAIGFTEMPELNFDDPLGESTGGATIFGATGGVIEAALRSVYEKLTGNEDMGVLEFEELRGWRGIKRTTVNILGTDYNIAVTNGLGNVRKLMEEVRSGKSNLHAIEVMACPGGCIGGAGQPYHHGDYSILDKRAKGLFDKDRSQELRVSHKNPDVLKLYEEYLGEIGGEKAHHLLHTHYRVEEKI